MGLGRDWLMRDKASWVACRVVVRSGCSLAGAGAPCPADCAPAVGSDFCSTELAVGAATAWLPAADTSVSGCAGGSTAGADDPIGLVGEWLMWDKASGVGVALAPQGIFR